jgi:hypothetical protein
MTTGEIIDFRNYHIKYNQNVKKISAELSLKDFLLSNAVKLLVSGKWESWVDSLKVGTEVNFHEKDM